MAPDLAIGQRSATSIIANDGHGGFPSRSLIPLNGTSTPATAAAAAADLDRDGLVDIVAVDSGAIHALRNRGDGSFEASTMPFDAPVGISPQFAHLAGMLRVVLASGDGILTYAVEAGATLSQLMPVETNHVTAAFAVGDVDGDGNDDVVAVSAMDEVFTVMSGRPDGSFAIGGDVATPTHGVALVLGDFDADGHLDLAIADGSMVWLWMGDGDGTFSAGASLAAPNIRQLAFRDLDGDGHGDLVAGGTYAAGNGDGTFAPFGSGAVVLALALADLDGDGRVDELTRTGANSNALIVAPGNGDGTLGATRAYLSSETNGSITIADIDGDGHPDLVVGDDDLDADTILYGACR